MESQTTNFIEISKSINHEDAYSVYKRKMADDNWTKLPEEIIHYIKADLKNTNLEQFVYE